MAERLIRYLSLLGLCALPLPCATAEEFVDPTRPPAAVAAPVAAGAAMDETSSGLQSIIISKTRRAAIIDGETVELGGKHGGARLIEVNEGNVVLKGVQGRQVLTLFPDVKLSRKKAAEAKPLPAARKPQSGIKEAKPGVHKEEK